MRFGFLEDEEVKKDDELQTTLRDINENGYHDEFGLPSEFHNKDELILFLTVVIFR